MVESRIVKERLASEERDMRCTTCTLETSREIEIRGLTFGAKALHQRERSLKR